MSAARGATADRGETVVETGRGAFGLRPECAADDGFLRALFAANNEAILRLAGIPDAMVAQLLDFQHRSQTMTYRGMFPDASYSIVTRAGRSMGRLIEHDEGEIVYFVDVALMPDQQANGLGSALMRARIAHWEARGCGARAKVLMTNEPSLKMCRKVGFVETGPAQGGYVDLVRPPGSSRR